MKNTNNINKIDKYELLDYFYKFKEKYVSGQELANYFEISRETVRNYCNKLEEEGYVFHSISGLGRKLIYEYDIFNEYKINQVFKFHELNEQSLKQKLNLEIIYKDVTNSTNEDAKNYKNISNANNKSNQKDNILICAGEQLNGKGRYDRQFISKKGGLYFTVKICNANKYFSADNFVFSPIIAAIALAKAIKEVCGIDLFIKWPNDLLYLNENEINGELNVNKNKYKKICGILTEANIQAETRGVSNLIIGFGINVNSEIEKESEISDIADSIYNITQIKFERVKILYETVKNLFKFLNKDYNDLLEIYKLRLIKGVKVNFTQDNKKYEGLAVDVDDDGSLIADCNGEIVKVISGEINFI